MSSQMTIYDISQKAGVSIATVSRVLNGSDRVKEKTRQKVLDVIKECGYQPNAFARGLGLNSMKTIGIMCADSSDLYLAKAVYFIEEGLRLQGYNSVLCCTGFDQQSRMDSVKLLMSQHVDSIILIGSQYVREKSSENKYLVETATQIPVMMLNGYLKGDNIYCIICDDEDAICESTLRLLDNGMENVMYLHSGDTYSEKNKLNGYKKAFSKKGLSVDHELIWKFEGSHEDIEGVKAYIQQIYDDGISFDSIVCSQDFLAVGAMRFAYSNKITVPSKLQVLGYNNSILALSTEPSLSSLDNRLEDMCDELVKTLIVVLSGEETDHKKTFKGILIERESTCL